MLLELILTKPRTTGLVGGEESSCGFGVVLEGQGLVLQCGMRLD